MPKHLQNRVRELREAAGLSMEDLARACRPPTSASQINKLEKSHVGLTTAWIERLADALRVDPLEIVEALPRLSAEEAELLRLARGLSEEDGAALLHIAAAMARKAQ